MTNTEPLAQHKRFRFSLSVFSNRIEVEEANALGLKRQQVILLRNVVSVKQQPLGGKLVVETNDGKKLTFVTGTDTPAILQAIVGAL